ncbi:hypothetical protein ACFXPY_26575 [Streptomyces sp. NPDC059153]|uniref:hypothetical protein n=1 Tax=Streptomyces sp. NPDC059153 TaxID=3346743 RepID=UPI0036C72F02
MIWISAARPGRTHDITAARHEHSLDHLRAAGLGALADLGFRGLDNDVLDPVIVTGHTATRAHKPAPGQKDANRVLATGRARLRPSQELAGRHQTPHQPRPRYPLPARPARPHEPRSHPLTDDLLHRLPPTTSMSTPQDVHINPLTCNFKLAEAHATPPSGAHRMGVHCIVRECAASAMTMPCIHSMRTQRMRKYPRPAGTPGQSCRLWAWPVVPSPSPPSRGSSIAAGREIP